jgi:putative ATP-dependent endonuclease of OLD family
MMIFTRLELKNFKSHAKTAIDFNSGISLIVGQNGAGKSTIFEAIDLVMGPERLARRPVVDEHDFYAGEYLIDGVSTEIHIEVIVINLNEEQIRHFGNNIEWWNSKDNTLIEGPPVESTDQEGVIPALRLAFKGLYLFNQLVI